jgi:dolichol-phosphate mannosyltransferase
LLIDDGSSDATLSILNAIAATDHRLLICALSRNFGHQAALSAGLDLATGDAVIIMDSDLQHPPELIPVMVERWLEGYDIVQGVREDTAGVSRFKKTGSEAFYKVFNWLSDTQLVAGAADFCLLSHRAHQAIIHLPERRRFLRGLVSWIGFDRTIVRYSAPIRAAGETKYTLSRMIGLAFDAVVSFSPRPLTIAMRIGSGIAGLGCIYLLYSVFIYFATGDAVAGWTSLICTILILGGIHLLFVGLIGEYLARLLEEAKNRPVYVIKQHPVLSTYSMSDQRVQRLETLDRDVSDPQHIGYTIP